MASRRKYPRFDFTGTIWVYTDKVLQGVYLSRNLSLGGIFFEGRFESPVTTDCRLEIPGTELKLSRFFTFLAKVVRSDADGCAIEFTGMDTDSLMFLQT